MPLGTDPRRIEKALATARQSEANLLLQARREPVTTELHVKEAIRDCDNLYKLQEALISAIETAIWVYDDDGDDPYNSGIGGEIWTEVRKILND